MSWEDAWAEGVDDTTPELAHQRHKPLQMETRGWLLVDDEVGVSLFYERCLEPLAYRGRTFIPRPMIRKVEDFPLKRSRSKASAATKVRAKTAVQSTTSEETSESTHG